MLFDKLRHIEKAGLSVVELNHIEPDILTQALNTYPSLRLGVGNILNTEQLEKAHEAGAHFASSLGFMPALVQTATVYGFHYLPGVATFSEAMQAATLGCQHVKPFPATLSFCTHLNKYLPGLRLFPTDVTEEEATALLQLPAVAAASLINPNLDMLKTLEPSVLS
ncbi:MAG: bifunctional 4-hydroxy-2-oxoglutarate aldolase/2-dehydro-3-deoxy-phosphogluconate aldolase [Gammaproteobacteria bacterium]|nr:bifunctional 4-hydroxy-2-oxoglutarate aldolase/2-dehydro-3-deoxy-phosphogluconate aldolase [Gammaproteobacteria bacterium]